MAVFGPVVQPGTGLDEDPLDFVQSRDASLCRRLAAQLIGRDLARRFGTAGEHALEKSLCRRLVAMLSRRFCKPRFHRAVENGLPQSNDNRAIAIEREPRRPARAPVPSEEPIQRAAVSTGENRHRFTSAESFQLIPRSPQAFPMTQPRPH